VSIANHFIYKCNCVYGKKAISSFQVSLRVRVCFGNGMLQLGYASKKFALSHKRSIYISRFLKGLRNK